MTLGDSFDRALTTNAQRVALVSDDLTVTFADLDRWSARIAVHLQAAGVTAGDPIAILTGNCAAFIATDVAVARLGGVKVPVNDLLPPQTIAYILKCSGARAVVISAETENLARQSLEGWAGPVVASVDRVDWPGLVELPTVAQSRDEPGGAPDSLVGVRAAITSESPAAMYFTGGTTGRPKGVVHSQASLVAFHTAQMLEAEIRQQDRLLLMTPLAHAAGLFAQTAVLRGSTTILRKGFDADLALGWIRELRVTWTFLVPTMIYRLLDAMALSGSEQTPLETVVYGAAPISPTRLREAMKRLGPIFIQLYGQTECPNWATRLVKTDHDPERDDLLASCGQASIHVEVQVVRDDFTPAQPDEVGEICVRGPYTMDYFQGDRQATDEKFADGWMRTGDLGVLDEHGYLFIKDRRADVVITGGMNVYCREVEDVLSQHPLVRAAAVIGVPHEDWGEAVQAMLIVEPGFDADELLAWSHSQLAAYARPKAVVVVEQFPETPFGKVDKKALRAPYWEGLGRNVN